MSLLLASWLPEATGLGTLGKYVRNHLLKPVLSTVLHAGNKLIENMGPF